MHGLVISFHPFISLCLANKVAPSGPGRELTGGKEDIVHGGAKPVGTEMPRERQDTGEPTDDSMTELGNSS